MLDGKRYNLVCGYKGKFIHGGIGDDDNGRSNHASDRKSCLTNAKNVVD